MPGRDLRFSIDRGGTFTDVFVEVIRQLSIGSLTQLLNAECQEASPAHLCEFVRKPRCCCWYRHLMAMVEASNRTSASLLYDIRCTTTSSITL